MKIYELRISVGLVVYNQANNFGNGKVVSVCRRLSKLPVKSFETFNKVTFCLNFRMPDTSFILAPEFCAYWIAGSLDPCIYFVCMIDESNTTRGYI